MKHLVTAATEPHGDDIILDFFSGSATTAHAVLAQNAEDQGNRRFIMVQLPEPTGNPEYPTIADIGKERIRRAAKKIRAENPMFHGDLGFKVLKLTESNFRIWDAAGVDAESLPEQLEVFAGNLRDGAGAEDILFEIMLKAGMDLCADRKAVTVGTQIWHSIADGELAVCVEPRITKETLAAIIAAKPGRVVCLDSSFAGNDALKTNTVLQMKDAGIQFQTV